MGRISTRGAYLLETGLATLQAHVCQSPYASEGHTSEPPLQKRRTLSAEDVRLVTSKAVQISLAPPVLVPAHAGLASILLGHPQTLPTACAVIVPVAKFNLRMATLEPAVSGLAKIKFGVRIAELHRSTMVATDAAMHSSPVANGRHVIKGLVHGFDMISGDQYMLTSFISSNVAAVASGTGAFRSDSTGQLMEVAAK